MQHKKEKVDICLDFQVIFAKMDSPLKVETSHTPGFHSHECT